jgi:hypothetical protein
MPEVVRDGAPPPATNGCGRSLGCDSLIIVARKRPPTGDLRDRSPASGLPQRRKLRQPRSVSHKSGGRMNSSRTGQSVIHVSVIRCKPCDRNTPCR